MSQLLGGSKLCSKTSLSGPLLICSVILESYSMGHNGMGVAHERISPKNHPHFSLMTMRQYWLGKTISPNKSLD